MSVSVLKESSGRWVADKDRRRDIIIMRQAASPLPPLAPGDRYPHHHHQVQPSSSYRQSPSSYYTQQVGFPSSTTPESGYGAPSTEDYYHQIDPYHQEDEIVVRSGSPHKTNPIMTGNGYFVGKSKSGTLPDHQNLHRYSTPPSTSTRGFRDTFISSMSPPTSNTSSPRHHHHRHHHYGNVVVPNNSNRNEEEHLEVTTPLRPRGESNNNPPPLTSTSSSTPPKSKWSFGGFFKRKVKGTNSNSSNGNINSQPQSQQSPTIIAHRMNPAAMSMSQHSSPGGGGRVINASVPSSIQSSIPHSQHQLSSVPGTPKIVIHPGGNKYVSTSTSTPNRRGRGLTESDLTISDDDSELERSQNQHHQHNQPSSSFKDNFLTRRLSKRKEKAEKKKKDKDELLNVPSPPDNGNQINNSSWEITKKQKNQLQVVHQPAATAPGNNYSSSGSLSVSQESGNNNGKASKKEAVKARAVARRESFLQDSSSDEDEVRSRSSIQGSHSSLTPSKTASRRSGSGRPLSSSLISNGNGNHHLLTNNNSNGFRPASDYPYHHPRGSPAKFVADRHSSSYSYRPSSASANASPNLQFQRKQFAHGHGPPGSPRWEARVVYTQENHEDGRAYVMKLPTTNRQSRTPSQPREEQQVITAGLRVPIQGQSGQITEEVHYANLPNDNGNTSAWSNVNRGPTPTPTPPPPPPRNPRIQLQNQNFYRPVSCSYLDSYNNYNPVRHASPSPNINNSPGMMMMSSYNTNSPDPRRGYYETQQNNYHPGYDIDQVDNANLTMMMRQGNNNFLHPVHGPLVRSPSEPPEIAKMDPRTYLGGSGLRESPIRTLRNAATPSPAPIPVSSSYYKNPNPEQNQNEVVTSKLGFPVRKFQDAGKLPLAQSPVHLRASEFWRKKEAEMTGVHPSPNPNPGGFRRYQNRIRSADSSPLPIHRVRNNSGAQIQNSNESISSLSSFSTESPHMFKGGRANRIQNPNNPNGTNYSATVNVRNSGEMENPVRPDPTEKLRSLVEKKNGKSPGRNLEDALNELETMYKSLRLGSDEDLLDRAERRDLPTPHQELRHNNNNNPPSSFLGSVESLATGSSGSGGSGVTNSYSSNENPNRVRAPPLRRSARPDAIEDDMARRRCVQSEKVTKPMDPRNVVSKTGSYMILSPAFSPPVSPCPPETLPLSLTLLNNQQDNEPDLTLDDVTFRQYKQANSIRIIDPQPPFGIPLGPISAAPETDYLHSKKSDRIRPLFKATKNPDLVNDDIAFRNLRKDLNQDSALSQNKDWTPRLFSPTGRERENESYNWDQRSKKLRAIRSLSANITNYAPFLPENNNPSSSSTFYRRWGSGTDLHHERPIRASTYWRPSWVEQVEDAQQSGFLAAKNKLPPEPEHWDRKVPSKTVHLTPADLYDPNRTGGKRRWTDLIFESFEKEKQDNPSVDNQEEENDEVFLDARDKSKSSSPSDNRNKGWLTSYANFQPTTTSTPSSFPPNSHQLPPPGHRGSWIEPRTSGSSSSAGHDYFPCAAENGSTTRRRRSWSDTPRDAALDSWEIWKLFGKKLFNPFPLPPARKIKQINLDKFNSNNSSSNTSNPIDEVNCQKEWDHHHQQKEEEKSSSREIPGARELDALMDTLIQEVDTCGAGPSSTPSVSMRLEEEPKQQGSSSFWRERGGMILKKNENDEGVRVVEAVPKISRRGESSSSQITEPRTSDIIITTKKNKNDNNQAPFTAPQIVLVSPAKNDKGQEDPSSIDELIDSINETLPELETVGVGGTLLRLGSSSGTKSNASSIASSEDTRSPSPGPSSPTSATTTTTVTLPHHDEDEISIPQAPSRRLSPRPDEKESSSSSHPNNNDSTFLEKAGESQPSLTRRSSTSSTSSSSNHEGGPSSSSRIMRKKGDDEEEFSEEGRSNKSEGSKRKLKSNFLPPRTSSAIKKVGESGNGEVAEEERKSKLNQASTEHHEPIPSAASSSSSFPRTTSTETNRGGCGKKPICKVPQIPSILTGGNENNNYDDESIPNSGDNSIRKKQLPFTPPKLEKGSSCTRSSPNVLSKIQTFEKKRESGMVVKQDSLSDAEGVSFIKKLLQREKNKEEEEEQIGIPPTSSTSCFALKKSPSAGSTTTKHCWSSSKTKTSSSPNPPVLFKKFFEKGNKEEEDGNDAGQDVNEDDEGRGGEDEMKPQEQEDDWGLSSEGENVMNYSVAQRANFFMKMEHEQRFSKWRRKQRVSLSPSSNSKCQEPKVSPSVGVTQPITITSELQHGSGSSSVGSVNDADDDKTRSYQQQPHHIPATSNGESRRPDGDTDTTTTYSTPSLILPEPSILSLKDRVHMFDKLMSVGANTPGPQQLTSTSTPVPPPPSSRRIPGFPVVLSHSFSSAAVIPSQRISSSSKLPLRINGEVDNQKIYQRRGSTSDIDLNPMKKVVTLSHLHSSSPLMHKRSFRTQSMYVSNDDLSEDGEVSSGGQEVAEIISRSCENTPVARKKCWKTHNNQTKAQAAFTREIWRRCNEGDSNPPATTTRIPVPAPYKVTVAAAGANNVISTTTSTTDQVYDPSGFVHTATASNSIPHEQGQSNSNNSTSPPATSNLLQILTVLTTTTPPANNFPSSSNDELDENRHGRKKGSQGNGEDDASSANSISDAEEEEEQGNLNSSGILPPQPQSQKIRVPHPDDDESFELFFKGTRTNNNTSNTNPSEMNVVRRESDLLVMKKNVPPPALLRRGSGKSSRNPLKALAARIDFRNQWYTDTSNKMKMEEKRGD